MPIELTTAVLLAAVALLCGAWIARTHDTLDSMPVVGPDMGPAIEEWRAAALHHFHEHKGLQTSVVEALATPGAITGAARRELMMALGAPRVDQYA
ncbi:hypothetical protein ASE01_01320 [Nocardioides sp. Root190]|uniref:hypothetical protein n=1 Tax=Nocardioides sp. Root190 TaxID=1736488 RepID=UPI0006F5E34A|nr:hypothetical protein [Nocardioides sp. Root190]KRB80167.1 hypothetical protein ASE01_01320 [Nocardioides sp. Root190]